MEAITVIDNFYFIDKVVTTFQTRIPTVIPPTLTPTPTPVLVIAVQFRW